MDKLNTITAIYSVVVEGNKYVYDTDEGAVKFEFNKLLLIYTGCPKKSAPMFKMVITPSRMALGITSG